MPHITLNLLGTFQVTRDARPVMAFASDEVRALLGWLAVTSSAPHPRSNVSELLWPGLDEEDADKHLHQALGNLHQVLGDYANDQPVILTRDGTVQFNPQSDCRVDVLAFREALDDVSAHLHSNGDLCEDCYRRLLQAEQLYRGDFLSNLAIESESFESWTTVQRETLHLQMLDVLQHLADYASQHGETAVAQRYTRRQVDLEPWWEVAHRELVRNLTHGTQRGWSLAPSDAIVPAWDEMEHGSPEPYVGKSPVPVSNNLTFQLSPFIGREDLLTQVETSIVDTDCHLLTLLGAGGSGKTRLAQEAAQHLVDSHDHTFTDGIYWVELASLSTVEGIVPAIAQAIGHTFSGQLDPQEELFNVLRNKAMLLVLDNFEHLLEGAALVIELLQKAPNIKVLTTTRVKLNASSEQVLLVPGMAYPDAPVPVEQASDYGAIQLFSHFAQQLLPGFAVNENNIEAVIRICDAVYGMPLGILLASSWMAMLAPTEIADEIERSLDFLTTDWLEVPARQRSMRAVFEHSWNLLPAKEQRMLASLSVFKGGWTRDAALAVAQVTLRDLLTLINKCLVQRTPGGRYEMHELLRQFAVEKLQVDITLNEYSQQAHADYFVARLGTWWHDLRSPRYGTALKAVTADLENSRVAVDWMLSVGQLAGLEDAFNCLWYFYIVTYRYFDGAAHFGIITQKLNHIPNETTRLIKAKALALKCSLYQWAGHSDAAIAACDESLELFELTFEKASELQYQDIPKTVFTRHVLAFVLHEAGICHMQTTRSRSSRRLFVLCHKLFTDLGETWFRAKNLYRLTSALVFCGERELSLAVQEKLIDLYTKLEDPLSLIRTLHLTGHNWIYHGYPSKGIPYYKRAERIALMAGIPLDPTERRGLFFAKIQQGQYREILDDVLRERQRNEELGIEWIVTEFAMYLTDIYMHSGEYELSYKTGMERYEYSLNIGANRHASWVIEKACHGIIGSGNYKQALACKDLYHQHMKRLGYTPEGSFIEIYTLYQMGELSDYVYAADLCIGSLKTLLYNRELWSLINRLPGITLYLLSINRVIRAAEIYGLLSTRLYFSNSQWYDDVIGRHVREATSSLPPDVVAAAEARGRELDFWETAEALVEELEEYHALHRGRPAGEKSSLVERTPRDGLRL